MMRDRRVVFEVGQPGAPAVSIEGLPISFDIQFKIDGTPNQGAIAVRGAARDLYGAASQRGAVVRLLAGYGTPALIFTGAPIPRVGVSYSHDAGARVLEVQALDAGRRFAVSYLDLSFDGQTSVRQVVDEIAKALALPVGPLPTRLSRLPVGERFWAADKVDRVLARLGEIAGVDFTIRDGALLAIERNDTTLEPVVALSTASGSLLSMRMQADKTIQFHALLEPAIRPGRRLLIEHPDFTGEVKARDVRFYGDPGWGTPFYTDGTARPL